MIFIEETPVQREYLYGCIIKALTTYKELTAYEVAATMFDRRQIPLPTRQAVAPRLTELEHKGAVEVVGSKIDEHTRKRVSVYSLRCSNE